jgi:hypothetical protein
LRARQIPAPKTDDHAGTGYKKKAMPETGMAVIQTELLSYLLFFAKVLVRLLATAP